jgi:hypothetical protein
VWYGFNVSVRIFIHAIFRSQPMKYLLPTLCLAALLQACALPTTSSSTPAAEAPVSRAEQALRSVVPAGSKVIAAQSLIIGSGENWVGRAVLEVPKDIDRETSPAYSFFVEQYPQQGWTLLSATRGKTSMLVFTKKDRSATVEISDVNMMNGSVTVVLTVTPVESSLQPPKQP